MISARVAPFARFSMVMTSAFLLLGAAAVLLTAFFAFAAFFAGLDLLVARLAFGFEASAGTALRSVSIVLVFIVFLLDRAAVETIDQKKHQGDPGSG